MGLELPAFGPQSPALPSELSAIDKMIKLFGLEMKIASKQIIILIFLFVNVRYLSNHVKITLKWPKIAQNDHYWTLFDFLKGIYFAYKTAGLI